MHITIAPSGSRGDVQPYIALANGFHRAGHTVRFVAMPSFAPMLANAPYECRYTTFDLDDMLTSEAGVELFASGRNPFTFLKGFRDLVRPLIERGVREERGAFAGTDFTLLPSTGAIMGHGFLDRMGIPFCEAFLQPLAPTATTPHPLVGHKPWWLALPRATYNRASYRLFEALIRRVMGPVVEEVYVAEGLPPMPPPDPQAPPRPMLLGISPQVVAPAPDWPEGTQCTGYWHLDLAPNYVPPPELERFIAAGPKPIYVGFGSMANRDPVQTAQLVVNAVTRSGQRAVLLAGQRGLAVGELPAHIHVVHDVPHDWLFPRMAAVVHHCGAGTTSAGVRAGVPTVPVPFFSDQPYWGRRLHELGVATAPILRKRLSVDNLAHALRMVVADAAMQQRAAELGAKVRAEVGVANAVQAVEAYWARLRAVRPA